MTATAVLSCTGASAHGVPYACHNPQPKEPQRIRTCVVPDRYEYTTQSDHCTTRGDGKDPATWVNINMETGRVSWRCGTPQLHRGPNVTFGSACQPCVCCGRLPLIPLVHSQHEQQRSVMYVIKPIVLPCTMHAKLHHTVHVM